MAESRMERFDRLRKEGREAGQTSAQSVSGAAAATTRKPKKTGTPALDRAERRGPRQNPENTGLARNSVLNRTLNKQRGFK